MDACAFDTFLSQIAVLSNKQCAHVQAVLKHTVDKARTASILQAAVADKLCCPRCQGRSLYRHGEANGMQRYRCRACGRTFNVLTGTPLARLRHKSRWLDYLDCMLDSRTVRQSAARVEVAKNTSMRWRHRFLAVTKNERTVLTGIAEVDETFLLESRKGARKMMDRPARQRGDQASKRGISSEQVCILVARDRSGRTHDFVTGRGPVTKAQLLQHLPPILARDTLLVTDSHAAYGAFARDAGITHACVNLRAGARVDGAIDVQNVSSYHSRFHAWLRTFHGVATRYLPNYLGWRWAIDQERIRCPETLLEAAIGVFHS